MLCETPNYIGESEEGIDTDMVSATPSEKDEKTVGKKDGDSHAQVNNNVTVGVVGVEESVK